MQGSVVDSEKRLWGFAHRFRPMYAWANMGHPSEHPAAVISVWFSFATWLLRVWSCGIPHLAKNERDAPNFLHAALDIATCAPFFKERRMKFFGSSKVHRKSGMWATRRFIVRKDFKYVRVRRCRRVGLSEFWRARSDCRRPSGRLSRGCLPPADRHLRFRRVRVWSRDGCPGPRRGRRRAWT